MNSYAIVVLFVDRTCQVAGPMPPFRALGGPFIFGAPWKATEAIEGTPSRQESVITIIN